jgi:hypothetical protein
LITPPFISGTRFGAHLFFAAFAAIAVAWVYFFVPETANVSLEQIDELFGDASSKVDAVRIQNNLTRFTGSAIGFQPSSQSSDDKAELGVDHREVVA